MRGIKEILSAVEKRAIVQAIDSVKPEPVVKQHTVSASSFSTAPLEYNPEAGIYINYILIIHVIVKMLF